MTKYKISGVWKDSDNVITHYAFHKVNDNSIGRAVKNNKDRAVEIVENENNDVVTWVWSYKFAGFYDGEKVSVIEGYNGKYLRSNPDDKLTDNLGHLIDFDWIFP